MIQFSDSSFVLLTNQEYKELNKEQAYYFSVNKDINEVKHNYFHTGYYIGCFNGVFLAFCGFLLYRLIKYVANKNNSIRNEDL